jgi:hypothetical protein
MTVQQDRTLANVIAPQPGDGISKRDRRIDTSRSPGTCRRAKQPQTEDGASMSVDAGGRREHGRFRIETDQAQRWHHAATRTGIDESIEERCDCFCACAEHVGIHVIVAAAIHVTYEAWLRPRLEFQEQAVDRIVRNRADTARAA